MVYGGTYKVEIKTGLWWYTIWWRLKLAVKKLKVHIWKPRPANFINRSRPPEVTATNLITNFKIQTREFKFEFEKLKWMHNLFSISQNIEFNL